MNKDAGIVPNGQRIPNGMLQDNYPRNMWWCAARTDEVTEKPLALGQHVIIDLFLPRLMKPIKLLAEVRNIESVSKSNASYKAGLKIVSISKSDLKRIENHLAGLG